MHITNKQLEFFSWYISSEAKKNHIWDAKFLKFDNRKNLCSRELFDKWRHNWL